MYYMYQCDRVEGETWIVFYNHCVISHIIFCIVHISKFGSNIVTEDSTINVKVIAIQFHSNSTSFELHNHILFSKISSAKELCQYSDYHCFTGVFLCQYVDLVFREPPIKCVLLSSA